MKKVNNLNSYSYLGVDISKEKIDVCLLLEGKSFNKIYTNNEEGFKKLVTFLDNKDVKPIVCMEATGKYHIKVATYLHNYGYKVSVTNPYKISSFKKATLARNKTDSYDALLIAEYCKMYQPIEWKPDSKEKNDIRDLYRTLEVYKKELVRQNNHLESFAESEELLDIKKETILHTEEQIEKIENLITGFIKKNEVISKQYNLLKSIPGIGGTTSVALLAELPELSNFKTARKLAAHIGITPKHNLSGKAIYKKSSISKIGSVILRKILYFPSITATRFNETLSKFFLKLRTKGKGKMVAIIAVMRKLVHIIYGVLKSGEEYKEAIQVNKSII